MLRPAPAPRPTSKLLSVTSATCLMMECTILDFWYLSSPCAASSGLTRLCPGARGDQRVCPFSIVYHLRVSHTLYL